MATQIRSKPASKAPVTRHPLFPAMVALWFGALFGLGSLAVRTSLIESLVLSLSLDVLVPAAAPPLGLKFRLILSLLMAATGVALGATLARRMARPKSVAKPRRRGFGRKDANDQEPQGYAAQADRPMARRRPLTVEHEEEPGFMYDAAPLPGGSPAILDVTQIEFPSRPAEPAHFAQPDEVPVAASPARTFEPQTFAAPEPVAAPAQAFAAPPPAATQSFAAPPAAPQSFHAPQSFAAPEPAAAQDLAAPLDLGGFPTPGPTEGLGSQLLPEPEPVLARLAGAAEPVAPRQMFRSTEPAAEVQPLAADPQPQQPAPNFHPPGHEPAAAVAEEPLDLEHEQVLPETGPAFAAPVSPAFAAPLAAVPAAEPAVAADSPVVANSFVAAPVDEYTDMMSGLRNAPPAPQPAPPAAMRQERLAGPVPDALPVVPELLAGVAPAAIGAGPAFAEAVAAQPEVTAPPAPLSAEPASRIETAPLAELSPVELIERLAIAMRQFTSQGPAPVGLAEAISSLGTSTPAADPAGQPAAAFAPPAASASPAPVEQAVPQVAEAPAVAAPQAETEASPALKRLELPAAMRPIDFADYASHDDADHVALPPRSFAAMAATPAATPPATPPADFPADFPAQAFAAPAAAQPAPEPEPLPEVEADVREESYSSLLDLTRPATARQDFVRIEEPEPEEAAIEPVVIFPGHTARPGTRFAAPDAAAQPGAVPAAPVQEPAPAEAGPGQVRRFDAPAAVAGAAPASGLRQDPEEAQRALRSALATLQRMSGAA